MRRSHNFAWHVAMPAALIMAIACAMTARAESPNNAKSAAAPDLSTAKSAALAWLGACWAGNASTADQIVVDDEKQRAFMVGPLRLSAALRGLESAAVKRFGEAGRHVTGYPDGSAKAMEKKLEIVEEGDRATASLGEAMTPLKLRRLDGKWRVDLSDAMRDPRAKRAGEASTAAARVADQVAVEIGEGKFKTVEEASAAFRERRLAEVEK